MNETKNPRDATGTYNRPSVSSITPPTANFMDPGQSQRENYSCSDPGQTTLRKQPGIKKNNLLFLLID